MALTLWPSFGMLDLIGCSCGKTECRHQRKWKAEARATEQARHDRHDRQVRLEALTPADREWLTSHGWDGR